MAGWWRVGQALGLGGWVWVARTQTTPRHGGGEEPGRIRKTGRGRDSWNKAGRGFFGGWRWRGVVPVEGAGYLVRLRVVERGRAFAYYLIW